MMKRRLGALFGAADLLDQKSERRVHEALIEPALAHAVRNGDLSHFARHTSPESQRGTDEPLGEGKHIALDAHSTAIVLQDACSSRVNGIIPTLPGLRAARTWTLSYLNC